MGPAARPRFSTPTRTPRATLITTAARVRSCSVLPERIVGVWPRGRSHPVRRSTPRNFTSARSIRATPSTFIGCSSPGNARRPGPRLSPASPADGTEASRHRESFTFGKIAANSSLIPFDVTDSVQAWVKGTANFGWVFINTGGNGWDFYTCEFDDVKQRPKLVVEYSVPSRLVERQSKSGARSHSPRISSDKS